MAPAQMEEAIQRRRLQLQQRQERQQQRDRGAGHLLPAQPYNEDRTLYKWDSSADSSAEGAARRSRTPLPLPARR